MLDGCQRRGADGFRKLESGILLTADNAASGTPV